MATVRMLSDVRFVGGFSERNQKDLGEADQWERRNCRFAEWIRVPRN